mmetsp:Transcript_17118/g.15083  ORF Transcript_17118/g.15083 Transcript_17118/m.15083 type:complete len:160 (+) Transcript_17118:653-1132(+)
MKEDQEKMLRKNKNRKEERDMDRKLEKLEHELEELQRQLREKEQENRISTMKINKYKRTIKNGKLKPISLEEKKEHVEKKRSDVNKSRSITKPQIAKTNMGTNSIKKNVPISKHITKKDSPILEPDLQENKEAEVKNQALGEIKARGKEKGTFETEVHL